MNSKKDLRSNEEDHTNKFLGIPKKKMKIVLLFVLFTLFLTGCSFESGDFRKNFHKNLCEKKNMSLVEEGIIPIKQYLCLDSNKEIHTFYVDNYTQVIK